MNTRGGQMEEAVLLFIAALVVICILWVTLEWLIYGEVQSCIVDDWMFLAWSVVSWCAYYLGRKHGKEKLWK